MEKMDKLLDQQPWERVGVLEELIIVVNSVDYCSNSRRHLIILNLLEKPI